MGFNRMKYDSSIIGLKQNRLTITSLGGMNGSDRMCVAKCDCGTEVVSRAKHIIKGRTKSCGCLQKEKIGDLKRSHSKSGSRIHRIWLGMISRCTHSTATGWKNYGGRGIRVCKSWNSFENFLSDMGEPQSNQTIERINTNGDYCPSNCRWATMDEQRRNKRNNRVITANGKTMILSDWANEIGVTVSALWKRLNRGGSIEYYLE